MPQLSLTGKPIIQIVCTIFYSLISIALLSQSRHCEMDHYYQGQNNLTSPIVPVRTFNFELRANPILSVVVHVVWNTPDENIEDKEIISQIERLNLDFNNSYTSRTSVPLEFRNRIGNPGIRFCMANRDPAGNPHTGITRIQTGIKNIGSAKDASGKYSIHYSNIAGQSAWSPAKYINIWIGKMDNVFGRSTIGGTTFPMEEDGIVIDPAQFGPDYSQDRLGRTLIHEMGHYLGLPHLWGTGIGDCTDDDGLTDTPIQESPYFGCPAYPQRSCGTSNMFMNFMDFVDDYCMDLFTLDQVAKMHNTLNVYRAGLLANNNGCKEITGVIVLNEVSYAYHSLKKTISLRAKIIPTGTLGIQICNSLGQRIHQSQMEIIASSEIPTKNWPAGIYFINLRYNKEQRTIKLFIP